MENVSILVYKYDFDHANANRETSISKRGASSPFARAWPTGKDSFTLLADRKRETPATATAAAAAGWPEAAAGNLYIEEGGTTPRSKQSQIARIQRNIETILSHKTSQGADWSEDSCLNLLGVFTPRFLTNLESGFLCMKKLELERTGRAPSTVRILSVSFDKALI